MNHEVTKFLDDLNHPFRKEIEELRLIILNATIGITENIKWNAPNYRFNNNDRITMRIQPPKQIQLVFHRGAKVKEQPREKLIQDDSGLLIWKENDRAIATFESMADIEDNRLRLVNLVRNWLNIESWKPGTVVLSLPLSKLIDNLSFVVG